MTSNSVEKCLECGKKASKKVELLVCTGCNDALFCSVDCQRNAFRSHRQDCLPCRICNKRIPGVKVHRMCGCKGSNGFVHSKCIISVLSEDSTCRDENGAFACELCKKAFPHEFLSSVIDEVLQVGDRLPQFLSWLLQKGPDLLGEICAYKSAMLACERLFEEDQWNHEETYWAQGKYAIALNKEGYVDEPLELLTMVQEKIEKHRIPRWRPRRFLIVKSRVDILLEEDRYNEALPLLETIDQSSFKDEYRVWYCRSLSKCYNISGRQRR